MLEFYKKDYPLEKSIVLSLLKGQQGFQTSVCLSVCLSVYFVGDGRSHAYETWWAGAPWSEAVSVYVC